MPTPKSTDRYKGGYLEQTFNNGFGTINEVRSPRTITLWHPSIIRLTVGPQTSQKTIGVYDPNPIIIPRDTFYIEIPGHMPLITTLPRRGNVIHYVTDDDRIKHRKVATGREVNGDYDTLKRRYNEAVMVTTPESNSTKKTSGTVTKHSDGGPIQTFRKKYIQSR